MNGWRPPDEGCFKFIVDGATIGKLGSAGIGRMLQDNLGNSLTFFIEPIGVKDSNKAKLLAIRRASLFASFWCAWFK